MIAAFIVVVAAALMLIFLLRLARGHAVLAGRPDDLAHRIRPVDVQAFRNLTDPGEEDYLRANLSAAQFRALQRERLRAALEYISCAASNAAILVKVGDAARHSPDPSTAAAGEKLVDTAVQLRVFALQAMVKLYLGLLVPGVRVSASGLAENYERMTRQVFQLGRLQRAESEAGIS